MALVKRMYLLLLENIYENSFEIIPICVVVVVIKPVLLYPDIFKVKNQKCEN